MQRKVNKVGPSTLTVSLPSKWVKRQRIRKGDDLDIELHGSSLILSRGRSRVAHKATLEIGGLNKVFVARFLDECYIRGMEEIILNFNVGYLVDYKTGKNIAVRDYIKEILDRYVGLVMVSHTTDSIILQNMIIQESETLDVVQQRILFLVEEFITEFKASLNKDFREFNSIL